MRNIPAGASFPRRRFSLLKLLLAGLFLVAVLSSSVGIYIDNLWFESLGFGSVYWYGLKAQSVAFVIIFFATAGYLWIAFRILLAITGGARRQFLQVQGRFVEPPTADAVKPIAKWAAVIIGLLAGLALSGEWEAFALYLNQPSVAS